jgi:RNA polymerase sigma-70 factor (ECF subfamily)
MPAKVAAAAAQVGGAAAEEMIRMTEASGSQLQVWIDRLGAGDPAARDELIRHACERLRRLTAKMLQDYSRLHRWEDTDDVFQNAVLRLLRALRQVTPVSVSDFFRLAAVQVRRELIDLARHYFGPEGPAARHATAGSGDGLAPAGADRPTTTDQPYRLAVWGEFHQKVDALPDDERDVFGLVWYQGLTQAEAARALDISEATVKRRWLSARLRLQAALRGEAPV